MGLAYPSLSSAFSASYMFNLYNQGTYLYPYFSMRLSNQKASSILFGSYNRIYIGSYLRFFPVALQPGTQYRTYWQIAMSTAFRARNRPLHPLILIPSAAPHPGAPMVNNQQAISTRVNHILDSGTTLIVVSRHVNRLLITRTVG